MSIDSVYEQWERQVTEKGIERGRELETKRTLRMLYQTRFGALLSRLEAAIRPPERSP